MEHIYPTPSISKEGTTYHNWKENEEVDRFWYLMETYEDKLVAVVNGHDHVADLRVCGKFN